MTDKNAPILVTGAAGLVGQNLCLRLHEAGYSNIVGIDKHPHNTNILRERQPWVRVIEADLAEPGDWQREVALAHTLVLNQAQIGGLDWTDFERNNITATRNILDAIDRENPPFIVHISSSVVNSEADDFYTRSKSAQEDMVLASGLPLCVLRPTLMFGWFDRKHLGWLRRLMDKVPVFPIPSHGRYIRQPLYAGDFCRVIMGCIQQRPAGAVLDISGHEKIAYVDLIRTIKQETGARARIVHIPYWAFWLSLWAAELVSRNPPFTTRQLEALVIPEEFPVVDWPGMFDIQPTGFRDAVRETFTHPAHSKTLLEF
ncbi:NAD-dependent epimerase/dehydratase family protein [Alteraurantiacibacter aestuarii]|uniref:NAD-dependent epimerase/dehydratase family protein n=1 Tax=Alteraurantiacibacter aestuarii TaxID=650004 RepID=UPI00301BD5AC